MADFIVRQVCLNHIDGCYFCLAKKIDDVPEGMCILIDKITRIYLYIGDTFCTQQKWRKTYKINSSYIERNHQCSAS